MQLGDLLDLELLRLRVDDGYVSARCHPDAPLTIYNYTAKAQHDRVWDEVTTACRGLIAHHSGEVIARPWPKFFNYSEHPEGSLDLDAQVRVFDKLDGSLGILYPGSGGWTRATEGWAIATRGSFTSDQAVVGTQLLRELRSWEPRPELTYLFEIIYPENRVVVNYGDVAELVLLDILETETGEQAMDTCWTEVPCRWVDELMPYGETLRDALELPPRPDAEGVVIRLLESNQLVKLKQDDYVELHRLVTGLNERVVWELVGDGKSVDDICVGLPDEFTDWVRDVAAELQRTGDAIMRAVDEEFAAIQARTPVDRKEFADLAKRSVHASLLFAYLDGRDVWPMIWRSIKPSGVKKALSRTEDVA